MPSGHEEEELSSPTKTRSRKSGGSSRRGSHQRERTSDALSSSDRRRHRHSKSGSRRSSKDGNGSTPRSQEGTPMSPRAKIDSGRSSSRRSGGGSHRKERSSDLSSADRDAKRRARLGDSSTPMSSPGAHSSSGKRHAKDRLSDSGRSRGSGGGSHRKERSNGLSSSDRDAKRRARLGDSTPMSSPGAQSSFGKRHWKEGKGKKHIEASSTQMSPGAHHASTERRKTRKERQNGSSNSSAAATSVHQSSDRSSRIEAKLRQADLGDANDEIAEVPNAFAVEEDDENEQNEHRNKRKKKQGQPAVGDVPQGLFEDDEDEEDQPRSRFKRGPWCWCIVIVVLLLIVGGAFVAWFFITRGDRSNPSDPAPPNGTNSPTPLFSGSPSSSPTFADKYDPPNPEDCIAVAQNRTTSRDREDLDQFEFGLTIDVTLDTESGMAPSQVWTLSQAIQEKLAPRLLGCPDVSRRNLRKIGDGANRFIIADASVNGRQLEAECTKSQFRSQCHRVFMELSVFLKGPIRMLDILDLISEKVEEQLEEEGIDDGNLVVPLRLEYPFFDVQLAFVASLSDDEGDDGIPTDDGDGDDGVGDDDVSTPVETPTAMPIDGPAPTSEPPFSSPSEPDETPTAMPIDGPAPSVEPSSSPSGSPSKYPTLAPVSGPTPPPSGRPTAAPSVTPSLKPSTSPSTAPTLAPVAGPSPPPSKAPTQVPSTSPSFKPTGAASEVPSLKPSASPSSKPSSKPSASPSKNTSASPSDRPSNNPSASPSLNPSQSPSSCVCMDYADQCLGTNLADFAIGCGSCTATDSCASLSQGGANTIGTESCTGLESCNQAIVDSIGDSSCTAARSCRGREGRELNVGSNSCLDQYSCDVRGDTTTTETLSVAVATVGILTVGDGSCIGLNACLSYAGTIGNGSCKDDNACGGRTNIIVGDRSCLGQNSCSTDFTTNGELTVRSGSCIGLNACSSYSGTVGDGSSPPSKSCNGDNACTGRDVLVIADGSCQGANSCSGLRNGALRNPVPSMRVGAGSCNCPKCCQCMQEVEEGQCNDLDICCRSVDPTKVIGGGVDASQGVAI